ncbi:MAG: T9SS type A sorting domain-containing protein [Flavobacteriales bacterium]|nr:T9SS type A sorting domain-containing protein [Flavobacteriales bacterium]
MKKIYVLSMFFLAVSSIFSQQIKIIEPSNPTVDVNGETLTVSGTPSTLDMEIALYIVNTSGSSLTMICTRTEVDGLAGTQNSTCWQICPATLNTGAKPVYTVNLSGTNLEETAADGDTITSFAGHYVPQGQDGCSLFKYEWIDATTATVYGYVYVRFEHQTSGVCTASTNQIELDFEVYPNPANNIMNIQLDEAFSKDLDVKVVDVLGQVVINSKLTAGSSYKSIGTEKLVNGVYFVTFASNENTILTKKIVVRH